MQVTNEPVPVEVLDVGDKFYSASHRVYEVLSVNTSHRAEYAASFEVREDDYTSRPRTIAFRAGACVRLHSARP